MSGFYPDNPDLNPRAITFDQLIAFGKTQIGKTFNGAAIAVVNGFPWYFRYQGRTIFQTGDTSYFRVTSETGNIILRQNQMLVTTGINTTIAVNNPN